MLPFILTALAGMALGIAIMRLTQSAPKPVAEANEESEAIDTLIDAAPTKSEAPLSAPLLSRFSKNQLVFGSAAALVALALLAYVTRPSDAAPDSSAPAVAAIGQGKPATSLDDVDTMITRLAERLKTDTTDGEGFRMLGWSYVNTGHPNEALPAYAKAIKLLPNRADVHAGYGEAMVSIAKDVVTAEAKAEFDTAIKLDPKEPRARFFQSLYKSQRGEEKEALEEWIALANTSPADLPWQADVRQRIQKLAAKLGVSVDGKLKPGTASVAPAPTDASGGPDAATMAAASKLPPATQEGMINTMVDGLAAKLQANPDNVDGWVKLIRSRVVLKDGVRAKDDLAMARKAFASDPAKLGQINALATELGL